MKKTNKMILRLSIHNPNIPMLGKAEIPFFISYTVFLVYMILNTTFFAQHINSIWKVVIVFCIGMLAVSELVKNGLTWKNIITVGLIVAFFLNILRIGQGLNQNAVAALMFYMFCARDIPFKKISWFTILTSGLTLAFVVVSSFSGIIPNYVDSGDRHRQYLGFLYALYAPTLMSNITLLWIYSKKEKMTIIGTVFFLLLNLFFFLKTNSRLCFYLTMMMLLLGLLFRRHGEFFLRRKMLCTGMIISFILAAGVSFLLSVYYQPSISWMNTLNNALGGRLLLGRESLAQIGMKPFGIESIKWVGNGLNMYGEKNTADAYLYVDSYYIQIAQRFGFVFLFIILVFLTIACYKAYKSNDIYLLCIFSILAVHFVIDDLYMYLHYNTFWLVAGTLVLSRMHLTSEKRLELKYMGSLLS